MAVPPTCAECGRRAVLVTGKAIYVHREDLWPLWFWQCPFDLAYVGTHPGTQDALGTPAGKETRLARKAAHEAFDPLWKKRKPGGRVHAPLPRAKAYALLATQLGLTADQCHIGLFNVEQCRRVIAAVPTIADWASVVNNERDLQRRGNRNRRR